MRLIGDAFKGAGAGALRTLRTLGKRRARRGCDPALNPPRFRNLISRPSTLRPITGQSGPFDPRPASLGTVHAPIRSRALVLTPGAGERARGCATGGFTKESDFAPQSRRARRSARCDWSCSDLQLQQQPLLFALHDHSPRRRTLERSRCLTSSASLVASRSARARRRRLARLSPRRARRLASPRPMFRSQSDSPASEALA